MFPGTQSTVVDPANLPRPTSASRDANPCPSEGCTSTPQRNGHATADMIMLSFAAVSARSADFHCDHL